MIRVESPEDQVHVAKIYEADQGHLFEYWDDLSTDQRRRLIDQISSFDPFEVQRLYRRMVSASSDGHGSRLEDLTPPAMIALPESAEAPEHRAAVDAGWEVLRSGSVGVFMVAGGQGSRLRFEGPKGMYPVGPVTERSLFQLFAERVLALSRRIKRSLHWFVMTSEENHEQTKAFFQQNNYFGLGPNEIVFAQQGMLPVVDRRGRILMRSPFEIVRGPTGHGATVEVMRSLAGEFRSRGVEQLFYMQVDNPMIEVCDPAFIGHHVLQKSEFSSKAIAKIEPDEKVGVFCQSGSRMVVVEYSELGDAERHRRDDDGQLTFRAGNLANHVISVPFVCPEGDQVPFEMPYHIARKATAYYRNGQTVQPEEPNAIKFESFLFDVLPYAANPIVVEASRSEYSPIKNFDGDCSPETSRRDLTEHYALWLEAAGVNVPRNGDGRVEGRIEISPLYADGIEALRDRLNGATIEFQDPLVLS